MVGGESIRPAVVYCQMEEPFSALSAWTVWASFWATYRMSCAMVTAVKGPGRVFSHVGRKLGDRDTVVEPLRALSARYVGQSFLAEASAAESLAA